MHIMKWLVIFGVVWLSTLAARAVLVNGSVQPNSPTVSGWTSGWGNGSVTGWDYVGWTGGASGVYLGNGWVITAAHVGQYSTNFILSGTAYSIIQESVTAASFGGADLFMMQLSVSPDLPDLAVSNSAVSLDSNVVVIGHGDGAGANTKSWGQSTVSGKQTVANLGYTTESFVVASGTVEGITGDSGGAGFVWRDGQWELAGLMFAVGAVGEKHAIALSDFQSYLATINATLLLDFQQIPEPSAWALMVTGAGLVLSLSAARRRK
ncbi:MAG: PEP-CTERM sorting domain-containing protein [Verrucomicrobiales bacterium]|nr:PEP-CTERM sorting domain-containing protein [Verrucomicrobiales bacterium]